MSTRQAPVSRNARWLVPLVVAALAVVGLWLFNSLQDRPIEASIVESSASDPVDGMVEVTISFAYPWSPDTTETERLTISEDQLRAGTVSVWVDRDAQGSFSLEEPGSSPVLLDYVFAAVIGSLFGLVMVFTMEGYGYVRGDGEPGSRPEVPVGEEQGFYWRT